MTNIDSKRSNNSLEAMTKSYADSVWEFVNEKIKEVMEESELGIMDILSEEPQIIVLIAGGIKLYKECMELKIAEAKRLDDIDAKLASILRRLEDSKDRH